MGRRGKKDLFPAYLALSFAVLAAGAVLFVIAGHPLLAIAAAVGSALVALPLAGWVVAWPFLEADIVVTVRANRGQMLMSELVAAREPDDRLIAHLARTGVISIAGGTVFVHDDKVSRVLAFFIRLRLEK
jgi:hypothetical protein